MKKNRIRAKILTTFTISILLILVVFLFVTKLLMESEIEFDKKEKSELVSSILKSRQNHDTELIKSEIIILQQDERLQEYWLKKDREELLNRASSLFKDLQLRSPITHFYFHDTTGRNYLRVHNPAKHGDLIDRFTMIESMATLNISSGIELGPLGTFTLRIVMPWFIDGNLEGYLELGEEIEHIIQRVPQVADIDLLVFSDKKFLTKKIYENGMRILHREADWEQFEKVALIYQSNSWVPKGIDEYLEGEFNNHMAGGYEFQFEDNTYQIDHFDLKDAGNINVSKIITVMNISSQLERVTQANISTVIISFCIAFILFLFFFFILRRVENDLILAQKKAYEEGKKREEAQKQHVERLDKEKIKIIEREKIINEQNVFLNKVINSLSHPFYVIDATDYTIQMANSAFGADIEPYSSKCYKVTHNYDKPCEDDGLACSCPMKIVKESKLPTVVEHIHTDRNGGFTYFEIYAYPIFNIDGEVVKVLEYSIDITEKKKTEEEISRYIEELKVAHDSMEQKGFELVSLNTKLEESENRLIKLNKDKDKFFTIISHDLKSPFVAILGILELLFNEYDEFSEEEKKGLIKDLYKSSRNTFQLLEGLLEWSRLQFGKIKFEPALINLTKIGGSIIKLYEPNASEKRISLKSNIRNNEMVFADENIVNTVMRNLMANAIKFSEVGAKVEVLSEAAGDNVKITVVDEGIGLSDEDANKIFRIDIHHTTTGTNNEQGTGFGLILCKELVELSGGKIWVESELGKGSKFIFTLPNEQCTSLSQHLI